MGSISPQGGIKVADIGVATIEKANGIVNRLEFLQFYQDIFDKSSAAIKK